MIRPGPLALLLAAFACGDREAEVRVEVDDPIAPPSDVEVAWNPVESWDTLELAAGLRDPAWRSAASIDSFNRAWEESAGGRLVAPGPPASGGGWTALRSLGAGPMEEPDTLQVDLPVHGDAEGPGVLVVQTLLDRAGFSPGVIDGRWGKNTEKAVYWLQRRENLAPTGAVDSTTWTRLLALAGAPRRFVTTVALTAEDVAGPFVDVPDDPHAKAELECLCYGSLSEKLAERFHSAPALLVELNPGRALDSLAAGDSLVVPNVAEPPAAGGAVTEIVISDRGHYLHALDAAGRIVLHAPTTLGSTYHPSPAGDWRVTGITREPWFHYQPELLEEPDARGDARLPPGPNSPVGLVWIALSKPHFGIHGTARPETIGYVTSHGCVRLTNWDALLLADRIASGVPVRFIDLAAPGEPEVALR